MWSGVDERWSVHDDSKSVFPNHDERMTDRFYVIGAWMCVAIEYMLRSDLCISSHSVSIGAN